MTLNPWFVKRLGLNGSDFEGVKLDDLPVPSGVLRLGAPGSEVELMDFDVPRRSIAVELVPPRGEKIRLPDAVGQLSGDSVAILFEERGAGELPRYEVLAETRS